MTAGITTSVLMRCFLRTTFASAAYTPHGLKSIGFTYAVEPALVRIYGPGDEYVRARARYIHRFNTHPFWIPLLLGVFLRIEMDIAAKKTQEAVLDTLKDTTANTLSAIGDSLFSGGLLITWALAMGCLAVTGHAVAAAVITLLLFLLSHVLRFWLFVMGLRRGMSVLLLVRKFDLINWSGRVKQGNAVLSALFLVLILPVSFPLLWGGTIAYLAGVGWLVGRMHLSRLCAALFMLLLLIALRLLR